MLKQSMLASIVGFALVGTAIPCTAGYVVSARVSFGMARFSPLNPVGDFDGDGRLEVVLIHPGNPPIARIYDAMTGHDSGFEAEVPLPEMPCCTPSVATAMNLDDDWSPDHARRKSFKLSDADPQVPRSSASGKTRRKRHGNS